MRAVSYLAPRMFGVYRAICDALSRTLTAPISLVQAETDPLDDPLLRADEYDFAFICGLPLRRLQREGIALSAIAAPVMAAPRYGDRPVYFADFIVSSASQAYSLADLGGASFAFNDTGSNSGMHLPRYHLLKNGYRSGYFGRMAATGAHHNSIQWVAEGRADCAAIDSIVLDDAVRRDPSLADKIRIAASTAACPVPPLAASIRHAALFSRLRHALEQPDTLLRSALDSAAVHRLAAVSDSDYIEIGAMFDKCNAANYQLGAQV